MDKANPSGVEQLREVIHTATPEAPVRIVGGRSLADRTPLPPGHARIASSAALHAVAIDAPNLTARVQAGVSLAALAGTLRGAGLVWPVERLEPGGTLGGLVASGRGSALTTGDAPARRWILGAEVIAGDGELLRVGGATVKNSVGYDLTHAMWGSLGQLGAIVELTLRLRYPDEADRASAGNSASSAIDDVRSAALEVRCEGVPAAISESEFRGLAGDRPFVRSRDGSRALIGCADPADASAAIERLAARSIRSAVDRPPEPPDPNAQTGTAWRALRSALDPNRVLI